MLVQYPFLDNKVPYDLSKDEHCDDSALDVDCVCGQGVLLVLED